MDRAAFREQINPDDPTNVPNLIGQVEKAIASLSIEVKDNVEDLLISVQMLKSWFLTYSIFEDSFNPTQMEKVVAALEKARDALPESDSFAPIRKEIDGYIKETLLIPTDLIEIRQEAGI